MPRTPRFSLEILRNHNFRLLLLTRLCGTMALQAQAVIVGWQIYSITKDPFMLGLAGLMEAIPALICALFAGYVVDNSRPYLVFLTCIGVLVINMTILFLIGGGLIPMQDQQIVYCLFAGVFISGLARSFIIPSSFTLQLQIVRKALIPAASAWVTSGFQFGVIVGPAVAGLVYGGYGARIAWMLPLILISLEFVLILLMRGDHRHYRSLEKRERAVESIKAGWKFILQHRVLLSVMALDMFAVLFGGVVAILPAFADQILHLGSEGLGLLRTAPALGAIATTLLLALRPLRQINAQLMLWMVAGFGICMIGFGLSEMMWLAMLFLVLSGVFDSVSMVIRQTLMQWLTPDTMRGRVSSVNSMFVISSNEIGAFRAGTSAALMGLVPSIIVGGIGTLVVVATTTLVTPKLRRLVIDTRG